MKTHLKSLTKSRMKNNRISIQYNKIFIIQNGDSMENELKVKKSIKLAIWQIVSSSIIALVTLALSIFFIVTYKKVTDIYAILFYFALFLSNALSVYMGTKTLKRNLEINKIYKQGSQTTATISKVFEEAKTKKNKTTTTYFLSFEFKNENGTICKSIEEIHPKYYQTLQLETEIPVLRLENNAVFDTKQYLELKRNQLEEGVFDDKKKTSEN